MAEIKFGGKEYPLRLEYRNIRKLEKFYPNMGFERILGFVFDDPRLEDIENMLYCMMENVDFKHEEMADKMDAELSSEEGSSLDELMDALMAAVDESVFLKRLETQEKKIQAKANLQKAGAI